MHESMLVPTGTPTALNKEFIYRESRPQYHQNRSSYLVPPGTGTRG